MEVGPLARVLVLYAKGDEGNPRTGRFDAVTLGADKRAFVLDPGRTAARTLETKLIADKMQDWMDSLMANIKAGNTHLQREAVAALELAERGQGRVHGGAAWWPGTLHRHQGREDRHQAVFRRPGMPARVIRRTRQAPTRQRCRTTTNSRIRSSRSKSCARSTASIRASPALST